MVPIRIIKQQNAKLHTLKFDSHNLVGIQFIVGKTGTAGLFQQSRLSGE
jgi:hypothetical protein